ncbi:unnamed protein product [Polarella glacialis]|uniref:Uncharacterized protein n=1 Tax=Polarella glacialis TaxID=89957 RepID=A0A813KYL6_POLGL|nr:unnamed protein product [Polarella glacialis]
MQRNGYPRLPPAAFPGGTVSGTVSTVPYPNGSLAAPSQPAGGFSAGPSLYRPALSPQHAAACGYLSRPVAPAAPVSGISPFFGAGSVRSVSQAAQPDFAVGQRRIPPQLQLQEHSAQQLGPKFISTMFKVSSKVQRPMAQPVELMDESHQEQRQSQKYNEGLGRGELVAEGQGCGDQA